MSVANVFGFFLVICFKGRRHLVPSSSAGPLLEAALFGGGVLGLSAPPLPPPRAQSQKGVMF